MAGFTKLEKAYELLREYNGENPHMLRLKSDIFTWKNSDELSDFNIDYILRNHDKEPIIMNKMITLTDWLGEKKKEQWKTDFVPKKVKVISYLGDTEKYYCFFLQYRQSKDPVVSFLPKNGIVTNLFTKNPEDISVDFDRYDTLSTSKDPNRRLREHQKYSVKFLLAKKKAILALDMGLGKSTVLSVAAIEGNFDSVLIICPASLKTNWKKELMWYVPERDISIVDGFLDKKKDELEAYLGYAVGKSGKKKDELLKEAKEKGKWEDNRFVIVNFDILDEFSKVSWARSEKGLAEMAQKYPLFNYIYRKKSLIIIDEAHKLSNSTSNRYKLINNLIKLGNPDSVYLSTGTPVTNMPSNLYCLLKLLDAPICTDYNFYVERYCGAEKIYAKGERAKWTNKFLEIRHKSAWYELSNKEKKECAEYVERHARKITVNNDPINLDELKSLISSYYLRMEKSDVTDLPKKHIIEKRYDLSSVQKAEYDKLWEEYEAEKLNEDPDKEINKELLEGSLYRGYLADQMVEKTIELTDKCLKKGEKVVIACCYDNELYALRDYYGDKCVIYNGKCSLKQKDAAIEKFRNDENVMVFIGNIDASSVGITLTTSRVLIFNSYDYVYANNSQMEDRIHRIGQDRECYVFYQMFNDTHCEHMWDIVLKKRYVSETLITSD